MQKTYVPKKGEVERKWYVVDADGKVLGRMAARIATVLQGKHKPRYTPFLDTGDFVIVTNAEKVKVTGRKRQQKVYRHWSGYLGGLKEKKLGEMLEQKPQQVIELAVKRMLPKTKFGRNLFRKLKVYRGAEHPHGAQKPMPLEV